MASKRNIKIRQCASHKKYEEPEHAKNDAHFMKLRTGKPVEAYQCKRCGYYHVGKRPKRRNRAQRSL